MQGSSTTTQPDSLGKIPLVVDLDHTLVRSDLLHESFFQSISNGVLHHLRMLKHLSQGKAPLKQYLADQSTIDYSLLPYNSDVLAVIKQAREAGRPVYLATASDRLHAEGVGAHLGLFDAILSSDGQTNLSGRAKAERLVEMFGEQGFDYIGDSAADMEVWVRANKAVTVGAGPGLRRRIEMRQPLADHIALDKRPTTWLRVLRIHQYAKNGLVFIPMIASQSLTMAALVQCLAAFLAFSFCASSVYIINDLVDLEADRKHPTKCNRPFASGAVPILHGLAAVPFLLALAFGFALSVSLLLAAVLAGYFAVTVAYSFSLKRKMMIDVVVLAGLYTIRVIGGAAAIRVVPSEWLLAFSMFFFSFMALIKRYIELDTRIERGLGELVNRNYRKSDVSVVTALAAASGMNAVTIFALYVSSPNVQGRYHHPELFWLICPLLLYWIGRVLVMAHRRLIDDDPIVFALRDPRSYIMILAIGCILFFAA
jgi:4-hydroxybenzoate polyprenyltransferase/phosphoserine phosphatase